MSTEILPTVHPPMLRIGLQKRDFEILVDYVLSEVQEVKNAYLQFECTLSDYFEPLLYVEQGLRKHTVGNE